MYYLIFVIYLIVINTNFSKNAYEASLKILFYNIRKSIHVAKFLFLQHWL